MFTVEMDFDEIEINVLDDSGNKEDVTIFSYDEVVYIRQWSEIHERYELIVISPEMYSELMMAWKSPTGAFVTNLSRKL
tara:strand:- start:877 stop:1113 length:237 start_codon:yes stop_codon:yes gene_type:complete